MCRSPSVRSWSGRFCRPSPGSSSRLANSSIRKCPPVPKVNVILPKYGMNMTETAIDEWLVSEGDIVPEGDDLCEITTDKVTTTVVSPTSGTVKQIIVPVGKAAEPGDALAIIKLPE